MSNSLASGEMQQASTGGLFLRFIAGENAAVLERRFSRVDARLRELKKQEGTLLTANIMRRRASNK
jgi:hypothetical protein